MLEAFQLSIPDVPSSYTGRLYCILGPGLGDTVNDFRILHEVLLRYPDATMIVYADPRWKDCYDLLPDVNRCVVRYHEAAPSAELTGQSNTQAYSKTIDEVMQTIHAEITQASGFVVLGGFTCLDQLAWKELSLETKARSIGLQLPKEQCRPFLPLTVLPMDEAQRFLHAHGLKPGHYIGMAPQTWADKAWPVSCWQQVIQGLYETTRLPTLVFGLEGCDALEGPGLYKALGLSLPLVAALLAQARCFVGLDSGLTHVAACFDVPIVGLQAQGKFPPFLVEPSSPWRRIHLTPFVYGSVPISPESVQALVHEALHCPLSPICPVCGRVSYVLGAHPTQTAYLCRCGLLYRIRHSQDEEVSVFQEEDQDAVIPWTLAGLCALKHQLTETASIGASRQLGGSVSYAFEHWMAQAMSLDCVLSDETEQELWWSWDAVDHLLRTYGWSIVESHESVRSQTSHAPYSFVVKAMPVVNADNLDVMLQVPWGRDLVWLKRSLYDRWLHWESFERPDELEGLAWKLVQAGYERDGRDLMRLSAKREWRTRKLGRLLRSEWNAFRSGLKNSQDACLTR